ncbi:MAG: AAA family ATPase [Dissulfuribacterales bacterium]
MGNPTPQELEREIESYLLSKYGDRIRVAVRAPEPTDKKDRAFEKKKAPALVKPEEMVAYLDRFVIKQDTAKAVLATKVCTHYNKMNYLHHRSGLSSSVGGIKNNIILIGPTGVGKTFLVKLIAEKMGVPFVKGDATKFSETGYVGGDVEDLVRELVTVAKGDIRMAQQGIVYIDEIDKIAASYGSYGPDVSRTGVQRALLKPMEETDVDMRVQHDPISQMEAMEHFRLTGKKERRVINTKNILFIVSGAFAGLADIIKKRIQRNSIGFAAEIGTQDECYWHRFVTPQDLIEYGFEAEFVGRLPVIAVLEELSEEDLYLILKNSQNPIIASKRQDFAAYGIDLRFEDDALMLLAEQAHAAHTGARALVSVLEQALLPFEKTLPSHDFRFLVVTRELVQNPREYLAYLLSVGETQEMCDAYNRLKHQDNELLLSGISSELAIMFEKNGFELTDARKDVLAAIVSQEEMSPEAAAELLLFWIKQIHSYEQNLRVKFGMTIIFQDDLIDFLLERGIEDEVYIYTDCEELSDRLEEGLSMLKGRVQDVVGVPLIALKQPDVFIHDLLKRFWIACEDEKGKAYERT